jgi:hypothetical protein
VSRRGTRHGYPKDNAPAICAERHHKAEMEPSCSMPQSSIGMKATNGEDLAHQYIYRQGQLLPPSRMNMNQGFARSLDEDELLLVDFCESAPDPFSVKRLL